MSAFQAPKGTHDVLPPESARFATCVARFAAIAETAGYGLIVSPMFEDAAVFRRGAGESSDVARKEMYEFEDKGGDLLALRPEGTASVVRAFVQHRPVLPWKTWYVTPQFRYEQPQAGRYRQHHQLGVEALGVEDPDLDVEVVAMLHRYLSLLGLRRLDLAVNSMGDDKCRPAYLEALSAFLAAHDGELCSEHHPSEGRPGWQVNPLRFFDCKRPECVALRPSAPHLAEWLCDDCAQHHARFTAGLDSLGIAWTQDDALVRGFDYYTRTTFEVASPALGSAQNAVGGGGRYNGLVETLGGPPTPGVGFGSGIERVLLACDAEQVLPAPERRVEVFVVDLTGGDAARDLTDELRRSGVSADRGFDNRSMKAQLTLADRSGALLAVIVGPDERDAGVVTLRPLRHGSGQSRQVQVPRPEAAARAAALAGELRVASAPGDHARRDGAAGSAEVAG